MFDDKTVAIHESGHAIAAVKYGTGFNTAFLMNERYQMQALDAMMEHAPENLLELLSLESGGRISVSAGMTVLKQFEMDSPHFIRRKGMIAYSGPIAHARHAGSTSHLDIHPRRFGGFDDLLQMELFLREEPFRESNPRSESEAIELRWKLIEEAWQFVHEPNTWEAIQGLADLMMKHGRVDMTHSHVAELLDKHFPVRRDPLTDKLLDEHLLEGIGIG